jgi:glycosyltransferase involved in cell wall biosynthesis
MPFDLTKYAIRYWCDLDPGTGFNNAARGYLQALRCLGLTDQHIHLAPAVLSDFGRGPDDPFDWTAVYTHRVSADEVVEAYNAGRPAPPVWDDSRAKINIAHLSPGLLAARNYVTRVGERYNVAITAWETDRLPQRPAHRDDGKTVSVIDALNEYDEVWVPSKWNAEMFTAAGVRKPVFVVRHALLNELLARPVEPWPLAPFVFYSVGTWNARKDQCAVLQAYLEGSWNALTSADLQLYCVPPTRDPGAMWAHQARAQDERERLLSGLPDPLGAPSHGLHTSRYVPYEQVLDRHAAGAVFVSASHGEAFGLPLLEALAMGRGVIAGGPWVEELAEIAGRLENGGPVDVLRTHKVPITPMPECAGYEIGQSWWAADPRELRESMEAVFAAVEGLSPSDFDGTEQQRAAQRVRGYYGPQAVSEVLRTRLEAIHKVLDGTGW